MEVKGNIVLAAYINFKVGGPARFFVEVKSVDELQEALRFAKEKNVPVEVLVGGTNMLVADKGFVGLVIKLSSSKLKVKNMKPQTRNSKLLALKIVNHFHGLPSFS